MFETLILEGGDCFEWKNGKSSSWRNEGIILRHSVEGRSLYEKCEFRLGLDSSILCISIFLVGFRVLFTRLASTEKYKSNYKIGFHNTIHTFKNYFAIIFLVFNF